MSTLVQQDSPTLLVKKLLSVARHSSSLHISVKMRIVGRRALLQSHLEMAIDRVGVYRTLQRQFVIVAVEDSGAAVGIVVRDRSTVWIEQALRLKPERKGKVGRVGSFVRDL